MMIFNKYLTQFLRNINKLDNFLIHRNRRSISLKSRHLSEETKERFDVQKYQRNNSIQCFGDSIPDPFNSFDCYEWPINLKKRLKYLGYITPTAVQSQALPIILQKRDLVAIANSGSGKTLCFVLGALIRTLEAGLNQWPKCLILTPTRELTHQIQTVVKQFRFVRSVCLYGGVSHEVQEMLLKRGNPHIVIATPSRLETILEKKIANLDNIDYVVVDEADHMFQLGFESSFRQIMKCLPQKRQTLMLSATWPQSVQNVAEDFLKDYIRVMVCQTKANQSLTLNKNIEQCVRVCSESQKFDQLIEIINELVPTISGYIKTIIFVRHKTTANKLVRVLNKESFPSRALHSDKSQNERDFVIREFRKGSIPILIATDVASRGLDFENVRLVINFDFPSKIEDYVHRIGRTGRHENKGTAVTLFTSANICHKLSLINILKESQQKVEQKLLDLNSESDKEDSGYESSAEDGSTSEWFSDQESDQHKTDTQIQTNKK